MTGKTEASSHGWTRNSPVPAQPRPEHNTLRVVEERKPIPQCVSHTACSPALCCHLLCVAPLLCVVTGRLTFKALACWSVWQTSPTKRCGNSHPGRVPRGGQASCRTKQHSFHLMNALNQGSAVRHWVQLAKCRGGCGPSTPWSHDHPAAPKFSWTLPCPVKLPDQSGGKTGSVIHYAGD